MYGKTIFAKSLAHDLVTIGWFLGVKLLNESKMDRLSILFFFERHMTTPGSISK